MTIEIAPSILLGLRKGDDAAVDRFVQCHQHDVYSYAVGLLRDSRDAEEVTQDAFVRAIRAIRSRYSAEQVAELAVRPWLLRITRNLALNRLRSHRSRPVLDHDHDVESVATSVADEGVDESEGRLDRALNLVGETARELLVLRFVNELSYAEIAGIKGGTESAARGKVFRALSMLRQRFSEDNNADL